ncbi:MAG TPA: AAA family ATPase [Blastocatellia bacterium]|nr:AAA family ATPase [Blastocatellia bacterium]
MSQASTSLLFPPFHIPANVDLLYRDKAIVSLERRAVQVLRYLAENHERVVTREELLEAVWPDTFTTDGVLKRAISQARRALGDAAEESRYIETYHGRGYRFIAPVTRGPAAAAGNNSVDGNEAKQGMPAGAFAPAMQSQPAAPGRALEVIVTGVPDYNQMVGREAELAMLQGEYHHTLEGHGHPVLLIGEPGIGKTQLAREFGRWVREQGALCLSARFFDYQASRLAPYEVLLDLLRTALCGGKEKSEACDLRVLAMTQLGVMLPEELFVDARVMAETRATGTTGPLATGSLAWRRETGPLSSSTSRAIVPISQCFIRVSRDRPLVLVLDDLQWADEASRDCVGYLMRTLQSEPLMIVGLARAEAATDRDHPLADWLKKQASYRSYTSLALRPLDEVSCRAAIEAALGEKVGNLQIPPQDLQTLHRVTGGNPYFLTEMLRLLVAEGVITFAQSSWHWHGIKDLHLPDTIVMAAQAQLDRLSEEVRGMAECAAVLGDEFRVATLAQMTGQGEGEIERLLYEGVRRGVLSERGVSAGNDGRFYHTILRHVLYDDLPVRRRKRLHLQAAQAIETVYAAEAERVADALSAHYEAAGDVSRTFEWSMRAWEAASSRWHWSEAMSCIERANRAAEELSRAGENQLAPVDRLRLLFGVGETYYAVGRLKESEAAYGEAVALANALNDRGALAVALLQQGQTRMGLSTYREAGISTEQALELYRQMNDQEGVALTLIQLGGIQVRLGHYEEAARLAEQSLEGIALNSQIAAIAFGLLGWARALQGHYTEGVPLLERAVDYMGNIGDVQRRALLLRRRHWADLSRGRYETAISLALRARNDFHSVGDARGVAQMEMGLGQARVAQGLYDEGAEMLERARASAHAIGDIHLESEAMWLLGRAYCESRRAELAASLLEESLGLVREVGDRDDEFRVLTDLARLKIAEQNYQTALQLTTEAVVIATELKNRDGLGVALIEQARALAGSGRPRQGLEAIGRAIELLDESESGERWRAYRALAEVLEAAGKEKPAQNRALEALRRCVALLDEIRNQPEEDDAARRLAITRARRAPARDLHAMLLKCRLVEEASLIAQAWFLNETTTDRDSVRG